MDTQQMARNQLAALLEGIELITGINYGQRIEELEAQNTMLVETLEKLFQAYRILDENTIKVNKLPLERIQNIMTEIEELALTQVEDKNA